MQKLLILLLGISVLALAGSEMAAVPTGHDRASMDAARLRGELSDPAFVPMDDIDEWEEPFNLTATALSFEYPGFGYQRSVVVDGDGNVHTSWYRSVSPGPVAEYRRFDAATQTWGDIEIVSNPATCNAWRPGIAVDNAGNAHMVWRSSTFGQVGIWYARRTAGAAGTWNTPVRLATPHATTAPSGDPSIAVQPGGNNVHVVFNQRGAVAPTWAVPWHMEWNGTVWSAPVRLDTSSTSRAVFASSVSADENNNVHVTWQQNGVTVTWGRAWYRGRFGGTWAGIEEVTSPFPNSHYNYRPGVAATPAGRVHVAWEGTSIGLDWQYRIYHRARSAGVGGTWGNVDTLSETPTAYNYYPSVWPHGDDVHFVWRGPMPGTTTPTTLVYRKITDGVFSDAENVVPFPAGFRGNPAITANDDGVHLIWDDSWNGTASSYRDAWYTLRRPDLDHDVGVTAVGTDAWTAVEGDELTVNVTIRNFGTQTQTSIPVAYLVAGGTVVEETWTGSLPPGGTVVHEFGTTWTPAAPGWVEVTAWTELYGEERPENDTLDGGVPVFKYGTRVGQIFHQSDFPPPGWAANVVEYQWSPMNWVFATGSNYPIGHGPVDGAGMAYFNSWSAYPPASARLITHRFTPAAGAPLVIDLWFLETNTYSFYYDSLILHYSTDSTTWTRLDGWRAYNASNPGWSKKSVETSFATSDPVWVGFLAKSDWGQGIHVDSVRVYHNPPGAFALIEPENEADSVLLDALLMWTSAAGADSFDIYLDTDNPPTELVGTIPASDWPMFSLDGHVLGNTTYYWQVSARNAGGARTTDIWSFTTELGFVRDVGATAIPRPAGYVFLGSDVYPQVTVRNYGELPETFMVEVTIEDESDAVVFQEEEEVVNLGVGESRTLTFATHFWTADPVGDYTVTAVTKLVGDQEPGNDAFGPVGFSVSDMPPWDPGWVEVAPIPAQAGNRRDMPHRGAWLATGSDPDGVPVIYATKGNKLQNFYRYSPLADSWTELEPAPLDPGRGRPLRQGARGISDGDNSIYMVHGNNTLAFWHYDIATNTWTALPDVPEGPSRRRVRGGGDMLYIEDDEVGYVYLLKGDRDEFWRYSTVSGSWSQLATPPPGVRPRWQRDSWLAFDGEDAVFALKARYFDRGTETHEFYKYSVSANEWQAQGLAGLPLWGLHNGRLRRRRARDGGAGDYDNGVIYALKGGNSQQFFSYEVAGDSWVESDTMPTFSPTTGRRRRVNAGADMVNFGPGAFFALKGNRTVEFWRYVVPMGTAAQRPERSGVMAGVVPAGAPFVKLGPNPLTSGFATLRYSLPKAGPAAVNVYDASGRNVLSRSLAASRSGAVSLDLRSLSAGIYLVKVEAGDYTASQKLVVQK